MKRQLPKVKGFNLRIPADLHRRMRDRLDAEGRSAQKLFEWTAAAYAEGRLEWPGPPTPQESAR